MTHPGYQRGKPVYKDDPRMTVQAIADNLEDYSAEEWQICTSSTLDYVDKKLGTKIDDTRDLLREEFHRVEEVMDARLKHLEERER